MSEPQEPDILVILASLLVTVALALLALAQYGGK